MVSTAAIQGDYLTQQYIANSGAFDALGSSYTSSAFNPYSSVFNSGYGNFGMYGGNVKDYTRYNSEIADSNLEITHKNAAANSLVNAPEQAIERRMGVLQRQIQLDNQDNIESEYTKLYNEVKTMYEKTGYNDVSDSQIRAYIDTVYTQKTQSRMVDDLEQNGRNPFTHGLIQGTGVGYYMEDKKNKNDNISMITGERQSNGSRFAQSAGRVIGAVATIAALPFALKFGGKGLAKVAHGYKYLLTK